MIPEDDIDMVEAGVILQSFEQLYVMGANQVAQMFLDNSDNNDGDTAGEEENFEEYYIHEIVADEEDPQDPPQFADFLVFTYNAVFQ